MIKDKRDYKYETAKYVASKSNEFSNISKDTPQKDFDGNDLVVLSKNGKEKGFVTVEKGGGVNFSADTEDHSPIKYLKREGVSLESAEASKLTGKGKQWGKSHVEEQDEDGHPHSNPAPRTDKFYKDHGKGTRHGEEDVKREDHSQSGKPRMDPRVVDEGAKRRKELGFPNLAEPYEED